MRIAVIALLALAACEKAQDVVDKLKPETLERFALYQKAVEKALANPVDKTPTLPDKLVFSEGKTPNADIIHAEWVQIPVVHVEPEIIMEAGANFIEVRNLCHGSFATDGGDPDVYRQMFKAFNGIQYLVLASGENTAGATGDSTYSGGFTGKLTIVDVDKQLSLGTIPFSAGMSDTVQVVVDDEHDVGSQLEFDAAEHARKAIPKALTPYLAPDPGLSL